MKSEAQLPDLRKFGEYDGVAGKVGFSCYWAVQQLTDEPIPDAELLRYFVLGWFLEPLGE